MARIIDDNFFEAKPKSSINETASQLDGINSMLDKLMTLIDKAQTFKKLQNNSNTNFQAKVEKAVNQQVNHIEKKEIVVDEAKAINLIEQLINNIPEPAQELKIKELKDKFKDYKETIKPYLINFIKNSVYLK